MQELVSIVAVVFGVGVLHLAKKMRYLKWVAYLTSLAILLLIFGVVTRRDISKKVRESLGQPGSPASLSFWRGITKGELKVSKPKKISYDLVAKSLAQQLKKSNLTVKQTPKYDEMANQILAEYLAIDSWDQVVGLDKYQTELNQNIRLARIGVTAAWLDDKNLGQRLAQSIVESKINLTDIKGYGLSLTETSPGEVAVVVILALHQPINVVAATTAVPQATPTPVIISETELYQALNQYRQAHSKPPLAYDESLCAYARERVAEHLKRYQTLTEGESPLDNHAGFKRDTDNEHAFELTRTKYLIENLAFTPSLTTATQVIEWGWDTSAPHRKGQLSTDVQLACVAGEHPFYVMILGRR